MAAQVHVLPCPRCGQKQFQFLGSENNPVRVAMPCPQGSGIQTATGHVLAQRARCDGLVLYDAHNKCYAVKNQQTGQFLMHHESQPWPQGWQCVPVDPAQPPPPGLSVSYCAQLVDMPMSTKGTHCPNPGCVHHQQPFGVEWIAANPNDMSLGGGKGPSARLDADPIRVQAGPNAKGEIAKRLGLGGCV